MIEHTRPGGPPEQFRTTQWSRVLRVRGEDVSESRDALAGLCSDYWKPLYHFARRKGHSPYDTTEVDDELRHLMEILSGPARLI